MRGGDETKNDDATPSTTKQDGIAILKWASKDTRCFCRPTIRFNLNKLEPTLETIAAIFGVLSADKIHLVSTTHGTTIEPSSNGTFPIQAGNTYQVTYTGNTISPCRIGDIYAFLGKDDPAKIHQLSLDFYTRIWNDDSCPEFQTLFTKSVTSPQEAADNQACWLVEMLGGPPQYTTKFGNEHDNVLVSRRMLSKHSSKRRMTFVHACTWLDYMNQAIDTVYGNDQNVKLVLGLYFTHFFGFFPFTENERIGIRKRALGAYYNGHGQQ